MKNCGSKVQAALASVAGVGSAHLDFPRRRAVVTPSSPGSVAVADLVDAATSAGFTAEEAPAHRSTVITVDGMSWCVHHCPAWRAVPLLTVCVSTPISMRNCGSKVVAALEAVPGVESVTMDFPQRAVTVVGDATDASMLAAISHSGFTPVLVNGMQPAPAQSAVSTSVLTIDGMRWCVAGGMGMRFVHRSLSGCCMVL